MKTYFVTALCNRQTFNKILEYCSVKPEVSSQTLNAEFAKGLNENGVEITVRTYLPVPSYPKCKKLFWGYKREKLISGITTAYLPFINIQIIKQLCLAFTAFFSFFIWLIKNKRTHDKVALVDYLYLPIASPIILLGKLFGCTVTVIVPDIPRLIYSYMSLGSIKKALSIPYLYLTEKMTSLFDGYILLTKYMDEKVNKANRPSIIIEAIKEIDYLSVEKSENDVLAIMYSGGLYKVYGILTLINAFSLINKNKAELWLFGSGDCEEEIKKAAIKDNRIKYFGVKSHEEVLHYQRKATVLVNPRPSHDEFTKYSFPSKVVEYMSSSTPVAMCRLSGIPDEYYKFVFVFEDETSEGLAEVLNKILDMPKDQLQEIGMKAKDYVQNYKNPRYQCKKVVKLFEELISKSKKHKKKML